jgi:hypothetical protein
LGSALRERLASNSATAKGNILHEATKRPSGTISDAAIRVPIQIVALQRQRTFRPHGPVPDRCEYAFDGVRRPQVIPMLGREVEESQQCFAVLRQAVDRLVMLRLVFLVEDIDRYLGQGAARRQVNFAQIPLHVRLH